MRGWAVLLAAGAVAGCSAAEPPRAPDVPIDVRVATIGSATATDRISAAGTVALRRETALGFTSAGRVVRLSVNEGDRVGRGQLLAALDATTTASALASAQAERVRAAREYDRSRDLFEKGWVTRPRVDSAEAALRAAEANVRSSGFQASNSRIVAPSAGVVLSRLAEPGQVVAAGTPVLVLGDMASGYVLRLAVTDADAARLAIGAPAEVTIAALGDAPVAARVIEIAGRADPATGTFLVELALPARPRLRSGQIGTARIAAQDGASTTLAVPPQAVFAARAGTGFVYVIADGKARLRRISVAETGETGIRVTGGLAPGERVAITGIDRLDDGETVRVLAAAR